MFEELLKSIEEFVTYLNFDALLSKYGSYFICATLIVLAYMSGRLQGRRNEFIKNLEEFNMARRSEGYLKSRIGNWKKLGRGLKLIFFILGSLGILIVSTINYIELSLGNGFFHGVKEFFSTRLNLYAIGVLIFGWFTHKIFNYYYQKRLNSLVTSFNNLSLSKSQLITKFLSLIEEDMRKELIDSINRNYLVTMAKINEQGTILSDMNKRIKEMEEERSSLEQVLSRYREFESALTAFEWCEACYSEPLIDDFKQKISTTETKSLPDRESTCESTPISKPFAPCLNECLLKYFILCEKTGIAMKA